VNKITMAEKSEKIDGHVRRSIPGLMKSSSERKSIVSIPTRKKRHDQKGGKRGSKIKI